MTVKVVYNTCFGGFGLSYTAMEWLAARGHVAAIEALDAFGRFDDAACPRPYYLEGTPRHHALLVMAVEELGKAANGSYSELAIKELRGRKYRITEYDGRESVVEPDDLRWIEV